MALAAAIVAVAGSAACAPTGSGDDDLPPGVQDPAAIKTPSGAMGFYRGVVANLPLIFDPLLTYVGIMTDELAGLPVPVGVSGNYTDLDSRNLSDATNTISAEIYRSLHKYRGQLREARGFLGAYLPDSAPLRGHLYALEGYAATFLADLYCSGVPLSTVDFGGDYTLAAGSSTTDVYRHAIALFDTASTLTTGNLQLQRLAAVGRGRALLALGQYADAAAAVAAVSTDFRYDVLYPYTDDTRFRKLVAFSLYGITNPNAIGLPGVADREGGNGLDYLSSGDPRTPAVVGYTDPDNYGNMWYFPAKYPQSGPATYILADGIEARLIEAEAALNASPGDGQWLATLNQLRATVGLADTTDPITADARINLLFRERAFWLYLTAHRQGDLRRLVRQYHRPATAVYPTGFFPGGSGQYGSDVTLPVPDEERRFNPKFTGCINRNA